MAARCGATGEVIAFEPDPQARELLKRNVELNPSVKSPTVEGMALSDRAGTSILYSLGGNSQSSLVRSGLGGAATGQATEISVPLMRLDDYLESKGLPTPRWVKIDAEGAEIRILKGAPNLLLSKAGVVCELHPYAWPEFGNTFAELKSLAELANRRIRYIDQEGDIGAEPVYGTVLLEVKS
jgi:FkbM family methyltransferase